MERITTLKGIIEAARQKGPVPAAIVAPYDQATLEAVSAGVEHGLIVPEYFGEGKRIRELLAESGLNPDQAAICEAGDDPVQPAIDSIRSGKNRLLMKGSVSTPRLMKACLDKSRGLNVGKACCHVIVCEIPGREGLLIVSDGGLNVLPGLEQKADIIRNMVGLSQNIGIETPRVAVLSSLEEVSPAIPSTLDAAILTQMARRGQIKGAIVDGPLALDNIVDALAAKKKGIVSEVAGRADAILVPNIETGNVLGKCLGYFAGSVNAGIVLGAAVPIILPSRAGKPEAKWGSLALGVLTTGN